MTFAITQSTPNGGLATDLLPPDVQQLANEVAQLVTSDPGAAAQLLRDLTSSLPQSFVGQLASSVTSGLDDPALQTLSQTTAGRDLLVALTSQPHDQLGRLSDALFSAVHSVGGWVGQIAQQAIHPSLMHGPSSGPAGSDAASKDDVRSAFEQEFAAKAANKEEFDAFMHQVFGDNYDQGKAEQFRQQALAGDFSFLPKIEF